jgi:hypothetical protein
VKGLGWLSRWTTAHTNRRRRVRELAKLKQSGLFDRDWYLAIYSDVRDRGLEPEKHYLEFGWKEGRDPSTDFSTAAYLHHNPDVAAIGLNPLLHYIDHGQSEGRGVARGHRPVRPGVDPATIFGPAAPCATYAIEEDVPPIWRRAGKILPCEGRDLRLNGAVIGNVPPGSRGHSIATSIQMLLQLSTWTEELAGDFSLESPQAPLLLDAWHAGRAILRTRWRARGGIPMVIRAVQQLGEETKLVAESLVQTELDAVDVQLTSDYDPVLFLFGDLDGDITGYRILVFPSLCRGGLHYPERLSLMPETDSSDQGRLEAIDRQLAEQLLKSRSQESVLVSDLVVSLQAADGRAPLFQMDFQSWLGRLFGLSVRAHDAEDSSQGRYLDDAVVIPVLPGRARRGASLLLGHDMVPTISALVASGSVNVGSASVPGDLIIAETDPAKPAHLLSSPIQVYQDPGVIPTLLGMNVERTPDIPVLAVRIARERQLDQAELLVPRANLTTQEQAPVAPTTWLIPVEAWQGEALDEALWSLAQQASGPHSILFVGQASPAAEALARQRFDDVRSMPNIEAAIAAVSTPLVGYLGPGVILHHRATAAVLAECLQDQSLLSATVPLLTSEKRGEGWHVQLMPDTAEQARLLWGNTVGLDAPPTHFWMARSATLRKLLDANFPDQLAGLHVCTSRVTASLIAHQRDEAPLLELPQGSGGARVRLLVG